MSMTGAYKLFFSKEKMQIFGYKHVNLVVMCIIFIIALLSIGFASAGMSYLSKKMTDPFVTCIDINCYQRGNDFDKFKEYLQTKKDTLGFYATEEVFLISENFKTVDGRVRQLDGRSFNADSPLREMLLSKKNVLVLREGAPILDEDFGVIVSCKALQKLGFKDTIPAFVIMNSYGNGNEYEVAIPILAVVLELPNMCDVLYTKKFYQQERTNTGSHFEMSLPGFNKYLTICCKDDELKKIESYLTSYGLSYQSNAYYEDWSGECSQIMLQVNQSDSVRAVLYAELFAALRVVAPSVVRVYDFEYEEDATYRRPDLYSCYFLPDNLQTRVDSFSLELEKETNYRLDLSKVNNLKNLAYVQQMGQTLSACIMLIAIVFICVFVYFLLSMHFQKIQRNIGTFKAFGVDNHTLYSIYCRIVLRMVFVALTISAILSMCIMAFLNYLYPLEDIMPRVDLLVWQNGVMIVCVIILSVLSTFIVVRRLVKNTPGDLIYSRNLNK